MCPICHKDLKRVCDLLGDPALVMLLHRYTHLQQAGQRLLAKSAEWPELGKHFEELEQALGL